MLEARYHLRVIRRLYVHNFRCLENFELDFRNQSSLLLIGKNGSGKTSVALALEILQKIARGTNRVQDLLRLEDFSRNGAPSQMRFELEVEIDSNVLKYSLMFARSGNILSFPPATGPAVTEEKLEINGNTVFQRDISTLRLVSQSPELLQITPNEVRIDQYFVALPIIEQFGNDPILTFRKWMAQTLILQPIPSLISGESQEGILEPNRSVSNLGAWFTGLLSHAPSAYSELDKYLKQVMPDFEAITNPLVGKEARSLLIQFSAERKAVEISFEDLSDGEKCFMICALVLAANRAYGPIFCFWDEPDNYLALSEVGHFVAALRQAFREKGQIVMTSHNPEAIQGFSNENTLLLYRNSHLEPTRARFLSEVEINGDLVGALIRDDLHP